jgi:SAM-dependent methyltransferase
VTHGDLYDDPELYGLQYRAYRDDLAFYRGLALDRPGRVLELGAGDGRVTVELARLAERVVALEPSAPMRAAAAARLEAAGLRERVELLDLDARDLTASDAFELAVAPFHMLNELRDLADQDAVLSAVRRSLRAGGAFACDVFAPRFGPTGVLRREATWRDAAGRDAELWLLQEVDEARQIVESLYLLDRSDPDGRVVRTRRRLVQRWLHRFELERALRQAGFATVRLFGDFDRRPIDAAPSRYVALATVA